MSKTLFILMYIIFSLAKFSMGQGKYYMDYYKINASTHSVLYQEAARLSNSENPDSSGRASFILSGLNYFDPVTYSSIKLKTLTQKIENANLNAFYSELIGKWTDRENRLIEFTADTIIIVTLKDSVIRRSKYTVVNDLKGWGKTYRQNHFPLYLSDNNEKWIIEFFDPEDIYLNVGCKRMSTFLIGFNQKGSGDFLDIYFYRIRSNL
ncbi:MAG: hypothetical protein QM737_21860 [Ferruginibacter sp.]